MRIELLQTFLKVVETGSFLATACVSGLTQSAISRQIQALEEEVGTLLLHRKCPWSQCARPPCSRDAKARGRAHPCEENCKAVRSRERTHQRDSSRTQCRPCAL